MIEIWQECSSLQTSQRLADQVRTIIKKGWFSVHEILEIHQKINNEQGSNTVPDTSNISIQKQPNRNVSPTSKNENTTQQNNTQLNNSEQTLSQKQKINLEIVKRIMNCEKTTLPLLRNIEWRTVKTEKNKINQVLPYISTNNITELYELIYAGAKLVCEKMRILSKSAKKIKTRMGNSTGNTNKNLRKLAKMMQQRKDAGICRNKKEKGNARKK